MRPFPQSILSLIFNQPNPNMMKYTYLVFLACLLFGSTLSAQKFHETSQFPTWNGNSWNKMGQSIAMSGGYAVCGAWYDDHDINGSNIIHRGGAAYFFKQNEFGGWDTLQKVVASNRHHTQYFGHSVAMSGPYAFIGTRRTFDDSVYVFKLNRKGVWEEVQKIFPSDSAVSGNGPGVGDKYFGFSVSVSGNKAIIGAPDFDYNNGMGGYVRNSGAAYIFELDSTGVWQETQKITPVSRHKDGEFGHSVAIDGGIALIGSWQTSHWDAIGTTFLNEAGSATIFEQDSTGNWSETKELLAADRDEGDFLGCSVALQGTTAVVGAYKKRVGWIEVGAAYVYERSSGAWPQRQKLISADHSSYDYFGEAIAISGNKLVISAPGSSFGLNTSQSNKVSRAGGVYVFEQPRFGGWVGGWTEKQKLIASDRAANDHFGHTVGISEENIFIGSWVKEHVYVFQPAQVVIRGNVFRDRDSNCIRDKTDQPIPNWIIRTNPPAATTLTDKDGDYTFSLPVGNFTIELIPQKIEGHSLNGINCPTQAYTISVDSVSKDTAGFDFAVDLSSCHKMAASVNSGWRRICSESSTTLMYSNVGFDTAFHAKAFLEYPRELKPINASHPYTLSQNNVLEFDLGTVAPNSSGVIRVNDSVSCNIKHLGLTPCVKAWVTPRSDCNPAPTWCGDDLAIKLNCINLDVVEYTITNVGKCHMTDSSEYRVYLDSAMVNVGKVRLDAGDSLLLQVITNARTSRLEVDQVPLHPFNKFLIGTKEACGLSSGLVVSKGYVLPYPQSDPKDIQVEVDCRGISGSYDPNDKLAQSAGLTDLHYIKPGTELDYTIRFQNTGNDTAFQVVVVDTLSADLDLATFRPGVSSHPYSLKVSGEERPVISFIFDPIELVDSTTSMMESQGFVKFSISPKDTLPLGTRIDNFADIYFDFNPPVRTPPIFHTIWDTTFVNLDSSVVSVCGPPSASPAGADFSACQDAVTLNADLPANGVGTWKVLSGNAVLTDSLNPQSPLSGLTVGSHTLVWEIELCGRTWADTLSIIRTSGTSSPVIPTISQPAIDSLATSMTGGDYQWFINGTPIPQNSQVIHPTQSGIYTVIVTQHGCISDTSAGFPFTVSSIVSPLNPAARIYPNPNKGTFTLAITSLQNQAAHIQLYDLAGKKLMDREFQFEGGETVVAVNHLPPGMYVLLVGQEIVGKVLIQN